MDATSGFRTFFAKFDIIIAKLIESLYNLIFDIASVDSIFEAVSDMVNKVYMVIGLFMLFKLATYIINYVINPDDFLSKNNGVGKLVQKIVISLAMLSLFPVVFIKMYNFQTIILEENIIGKIILDEDADDIKASNYGKELSYMIFTSFLDYSRLGDLEKVFPKSCPNLFLKSDTSNTVGDSVNYCGNGVPMHICAYYLSPNIQETDKYANAHCELEENRNKNTCQELMELDSREKYYDCKSGKDLKTATINCGIPNGLYIAALLSNARKNHDISIALSNEIISAVTSDPLLDENVENYCPKTALNGGYPVANGDLEKGKYDVESAGDYVFSYNIPWSTLSGLVILVMFVILSVDVAVRAIKLVFLQLIAPIPIISYIDIKEDGLFKKWLKLVINTYLELFFKLASIFLALFFILCIVKGKYEGLEVIKDNVMAQILFIAGVIMFAIKLPDMLSKLFNLGSDGGVMSLIKGATNFLIGAGAATVAGVGGGVSNLAAGVEKVSEAKGAKAKALAIGKTGLSVLGGTGSAMGRSVGRQVKNGGKVGLYDVKASIRGSVNARQQNEVGRYLPHRFMDELRDISQINPRQHLDSTSIQKEIDKLKDDQKHNNEIIKSTLSNNSHASQIREAFRINSDGNRVYANYDAYVNAQSSDLTEDEYDSVSYLFDRRDEIAKQIKNYQEQYQHELSNENFEKSNKSNK